MNAPTPKARTAKEIFQAAIEYYDPHQWEGYISDACSDDLAKRERVRELLRAHQQQDSFFDDKEAPTSDSVITERPGMQIGPYKLLQEIGEGGFGIVYMAEQLEPIRRKVALKIIKPGMDTKQVVARFEAERQALAMMDHPNIAKVLDAGATESGRPYFVMELVKGVPITEFCDENKLATRKRLELFALVCRAIQHAHQKGVIHRDLKPSNIMVTMHNNSPVPVIIDFGVSKAISQQLTEKTLFTAYGQMVGTPAYMSPEQAQMSRMDIDTRSDIYSLGVLLYELLTGSTPLDASVLRGTAYVEMQRMIREEEAPKPSTRVSTMGNALARIAKCRDTDPIRLSHSLKGDLDWITMKALDKDPTRRYETANGFANDVDRFLDDEAVEACPPSLIYQTRKLFRRHRAMATTAAAVGVAILLGIIGTTAGMFQARDEAKQTQIALSDVKEAKEQADAAVDVARASKVEADTQRDKAQQLVAKQWVDRATLERQRGDTALAALLNVEALKSDSDSGERELAHRQRIAADLRQCAIPEQMFFHGSRVNDARFSSDGKWIASGADNGTVKIWNAETGELEKTLEHKGSIHQLVFAYHDKLRVSEVVEFVPESGMRGLHHIWDWNKRIPTDISIPSGLYGWS